MSDRHTRPYVIAAILAGIILFAYAAGPTQLDAGQKSLVDIRDIESLRARFNQDAGRIRLMMILNPG